MLFSLFMIFSADLFVDIFWGEIFLDFPSRNFVTISSVILKMFSFFVFAESRLLSNS